MKRIKIVWTVVTLAVLVSMTMPNLIHAQTAAQRRAHAAASERLAEEAMGGIVDKIKVLVDDTPILSDETKADLAEKLLEAVRPIVQEVIERAAVGRLPSVDAVMDDAMTGLSEISSQLTSEAVAATQAAITAEAVAAAAAEEARIAAETPPPAPAAVIHVPSQVPTIMEAMLMARVGDSVKVAPGIYRERVVMAPGVALVSTELFGATINGKGRGTVVTMARNGSIDGFVITNGTIGVFTSDIGNDITRCRIVRNFMTGIITVRQLPQIQDNIIAFNGASGIQAWDVRSTATSVNHNSIAYNGNHGIAIGGSSEFIIENNLIAFNEKFGLKVLEGPDRIQVSANNFYRNLFQPNRPVPEGNYVFDPAFIAPRSGMNFNLDPGLCCQERSSSGENLGARLNY
ncbi:MAG: right-handed parallel beta-helix repeat-containing protein [Chitinispirillales bacterium]|jgi:hypothetical protein|nr:right-handed parallel beta-helix repeat-containing protein [Chitinispirillales bacterium]